MNKENIKRMLLFASLATITFGLGFLSSCSNGDSADSAKGDKNSAINYVTLDENEKFTLGSYPQDVTDSVSKRDLLDKGAEKKTSQGVTYYLYENKKYMVLNHAEIDTEGSNNRFLSNGASVNSYIDRTDIVIEFKELEWQLLKESQDGNAFLITTSVIDREIYNNTEFTALYYYQSSLFEYLNTSFKELAFSDEDYKYLTHSEDGYEKVQIGIPDKDDVNLDFYPDKNLKQASDFAILKNLSSHSSWNHGTGVPYLNAGYWLNNRSDEGDRIKVCWAKVSYSDCLMDDPKIGIRPVIEVNYKKSSGGSDVCTDCEAKTEGKTSKKDGNAVLPLGITFSILGAGGLIALFILWYKKFPTSKPPVWMIASLAGSLVVAVAGIGCFAGGLGGGGTCFEYGYYVQADLYSGNGIAQVGYTAWLLKSDGSAYYCSSLKDNKTASDFSADNYMTGTYTINGSKLVIDVPKREINNFGTVGGTYTFTISSCTSFKNYMDTYNWVRGE